MMDMQDRWAINIAQVTKTKPRHWAKVLLDGIGETRKEAIEKAKLLQRSLGEGYLVTMTRWEGRGYDIPLE